LHDDDDSQCDSNTGPHLRLSARQQITKAKAQNAISIWPA